MPAARGQHLFTRTKRHLMDWAQAQGMAGMYSEATAAHPYSQRANVELGAHETGFLLGWIPASVSNDAAEGAAPQAPVGGALLHQAERRARAPGLRAGAPPGDRRPHPGAVRAARDAGRATARRRAGGPDRAARRGRRRPQPRPDHRPHSRRGPGGGDRRRAPPPLPPRRARRHLRRPAAGDAGDGPGRRPPRALGVSYAGSSPTAAPTATSCACSRCTGSESQPTT